VLVGPVADFAAALSQRNAIAPGTPPPNLTLRREMLAASLRPLEPYPGKAAAPWRCECLRCGDVVIARLQKIRSGQRRGVADTPPL